MSQHETKEFGIAALVSRPKLIGSVDERMISLMRLILASSALFIIFIDPSEPDRLVPINYGALVLYVVYSLVLYAVSLLHPAGFRSLPS